MNWEKLQDAKSFLQKRLGTRSPRYAVVLGSGLGGVLDEMPKKETELSFSEIPHMASARVEGHQGRIVVGAIGGVRLVGVQGRLHFYEGHAMDQVVFLVR